MRNRLPRGFTVIEVMIVTVIISILAAVAIPQFSAYRTRGFDTTAQSALKNSYTLAQAYFTDNPGGTVTSTVLTAYGYSPSAGIVVSVANGTMGGLSILASHSSGTQTYMVDSNGVITPQMGSLTPE